MNLADYIIAISKPKGLSEVKETIITELWGNGAFPSQWVMSSHLLAITNQKYFDRRVRELRDEHGCNIENSIIQGEHVYRLIGTTIGATNTRTYLTASQKTKLFTDQKFTCQVCGKITEAGPRGLQADHKVPLIKGGQHDYDNWQAMCNECNVAKRRACQDCNLDCNLCFWAFPDKTLMPITIFVSRETFDRVDQKLKLDENWIRNLVEKSMGD
jgi:hypothetical protein